MSTGQVQKRATAKRDLVRHYVYLAEAAGIETAERFLLQADESFSNLALHPEMGVALVANRPELVEIRKWHVKGFENFLIFYQARQHGVSIVRVLHGSQDWWSFLGVR